MTLGINNDRIAPEAAGAVWNAANTPFHWGDVAIDGKDFISAVALVSVFGTVNGFVLTAPRIFHAFSKDGGLVRRMGTLNKHGTPAWAIYFTAVWASLLVMTGGYDQLVTMVVFGIFLFYIPTSYAHLRMRGVRWLGLRGTHRNVERPYKTPWYPVIPIVFLLASIFVVVSILLTSLAQALIALVILAIGIPVYFQQRRGMDEAAKQQALEKHEEELVVHAPDEEHGFA